MAVPPAPVRVPNIIYSLAYINKTEENNFVPHSIFVMEYNMYKKYRLESYYFLFIELV